MKCVAAYSTVQYSYVRVEIPYVAAGAGSDTPDSTGSAPTREERRQPASRTTRDTEQRADSEHEQRGDSKVVAPTSQGDFDISNAVPQNAQSAAAGTDGTALRKARRTLAERDNVGLL